MRTVGDWCTKPLKNAGPTVVTMDHSRPMIDQDGKNWPTIEQVCECRSMDDAHLIAAAPELYEALKWFIDDIDSTHTKMLDFDANVERARKALAKAQGQPSL